jgi:formate hydrogenlyase transcriptional activator
MSEERNVGIRSALLGGANAPAAAREQTALDHLLELLPDAAITTDPDGRIVSMNGHAERMFGYTSAELQGEPVHRLLPERFREAHRGYVRGYIASPHRRPMGAGLELFGKRKDGGEFPVDIMLSPVGTADNRLALAVVRDMTEHLRMEHELRSNEEQLRTMIESVKDYAIFTLDAAGRVTSWNPGAERIKGYRAGEIIGRHFSEFYLSEDVERGKPQHALEAAAAHGRVEDEGWRRRKDGSRFWADVTISVRRDAAGNAMGYTKVTRDVTGRRQAEAALLLEVTNTLISSLDIRRLFAAISAGIRQVMPHDFAALALYDRDAGRLRLNVLDAPEGADLQAEGRLLPLEGSPSAQVFTSREPMWLERIESAREHFSSEFIEGWTGMGMKSGCWLPLLSRGKALGTLVVGSGKECAFTAKDAETLSLVANQVALAIDNAVAYRRVAELKDRLAEEKAYLEEELSTEYNFEEIVGESTALRRVLKQVETVAPTGATVLIHGETGTGKELIARAIHNLSPRHGRTFVKLNCAAIPSGLLESELFGHEKGAFTGAISQKVGRLELAHQGTLFLDEVGDITLEIQPKLLRALQEREFERLGSTRTIPVDVRLIAATNRDLSAMVKAREFREDLFYRLRVFPVHVPPLREREDDIVILAHHFVQKHARRMNRRIDTIPSEALEALRRWHWPGNVRELENLIERAVILTTGSVLRIPLAELAGPAPSDLTRESVATLESADREHILRALRQCGGRIAGPHGAAALLGLKRTTLNAKIKKLRITRSEI